MADGGPEQEGGGHPKGEVLVLNGDELADVGADLADLDLDDVGVGDLFLLFGLVDLVRAQEPDDGEPARLEAEQVGAVEHPEAV